MIKVFLFLFPYYLPIHAWVYCFPFTNWITVLFDWAFDVNTSSRDN